MSDHLRNDLAAALTASFSSADITRILSAFDSVAASYTISEAPTSLAVVGRQQLLDCIQLFLVVRQSQGGSHKTTKLYHNILTRFAMQTTQPMDHLTANDIRSWIYRMQSAGGISDRSLQTYRVIVCSFLHWCSAEGYIPRDITTVIKNIRTEKRHISALSQLDMERLRAACADLRDRALVQTMYSTGCRASEIVGIKLADINWTDKTIWVLGKGNKHRTVYLNSKAEFAIHAYIDSRTTQSDHLFCRLRDGSGISTAALEKIFRTLKTRSGITARLTPHVLRHTMATQAATIAPIQEVQAMLGHESINTTMIYAEVNKQQIELHHKMALT